MEGLKGLPRWKLRGRRGRLLYSSEVTSSSLSYAAGELLLLAGGEQVNEDEEVEVKSKFTPQQKNDGGVKIKGKRINEYDDDELYYLQDYLGIPYKSSSPPPPSTTNTPLNSITFDFPKHKPFLASSVTSQKIIKSSEKTLPTKKRKVIRDMESLNVVANHNYDGDDDNDDDDRKQSDDHDVEEDGKVVEKKWSCTTCGKSFDTHQALGGHRSSHNKERANQSKKPNHNSAQAQAQARIEKGSGLTHLGSSRENGVIESGNAEEVVGGLVHKCKICNQGFPSGRALGGHQRCHYVVPGQTSSQTGHQSTVYGLDLNVTMQEEDGDGAIASIYSYS